MQKYLSKLYSNGIQAGFHFVLVLSLLYGSTLVVSRFSVGQYDPRTYVTLRLLLVSLGYIVFFWFSTDKAWPTTFSLWARAGVLGILGTTLPMVSMVSSLQYQSSGVTSLLITLTPVVTVIFAALLLDDEPLTKYKGLGIFVAFCGAGLLLVQGENGLADFAEADWRGYAWSGLGNLFGGASAVFARRYLRDEDMWSVSSARMLIAALTLLPVTALTVGFDMSNVTLVGYGGLIYASIAGTFLGMWLSFYVIKRYSALAGAQVAYIMPVVATILGTLVLGELITPTMLIGMVIIFAGVALLNRRQDDR